MGRSSLVCQSCSFGLPKEAGMLLAEMLGYSIKSHCSEGRRSEILWSLKRSWDQEFLPPGTIWLNGIKCCEAGGGGHLTQLYCMFHRRDPQGSLPHTSMSDSV